MKKLTFSYLIVSLLLVSAPVLAVPNFSEVALETPGVSKTLNLPESALNSSVISLGSAVDPVSGELVEGFAIIHRNNDARPDHSVKPTKPSKDEASACYTFLARDTRWNVSEPWLVNATNTQGLAEDFVLNNLVMNVEKWENAAEGADILGEGVLTSDLLEVDTITPDGLNEVVFGSIEDSGAIAVTIIWGVFSGPPHSRKLIEWDMVFDEVDFAWSNSGELDKMDFENIATHELGHSVGMGDLYESGCGEETMYGYATEGETKKRDLNTGDIAGIKNLY